MNAVALACAISGRLPNLRSMNASVPSVGRLYIQLISPSAKKFFERSASRGVIPAIPFSPSTVIEVSPTGWTW